MRAERPAWFIAPAAAVLAAVTLFPLAHVLLTSLTRHSLIGADPAFVGARNWLRLARDERFWNALGNTLHFAAVSVSLELALGLAFALLIERTRRGRGALYAVILLPWAVPAAVSARMWEWMYNADIGVINHVLGIEANWLGAPGWALHAAILMDVWKSTPFVTLLLVAGLQAIPRELTLAAAVDGATPRQVLLRVTLPLLAPLLLVALVFRSIDALRVFDAVYVLTGGGPGNSTETLSIYAYKELFQALELGYGSTLAMTTFLCAAAATLLYVVLMRRSLA